MTRVTESNIEIMYYDLYIQFIKSCKNCYFQVKKEKKENVCTIHRDP